MDVDGDGHGTFIASLIRQVSPTSGVIIARTQTVPPSEFLSSDPNHDLPKDPITGDFEAVTSEIEVAGALAPVLTRADPLDPVALNLSLGTYACTLPDVENASPTLSFEKALQDWTSTIPSAQIIAAAGNHPFDSPFYPASLGGVIGVEPVDEGGNVIVWVNRNRMILGQARDLKWASVQAPGIDLIGVLVNQQTKTTEIRSWSGSSFATPVVAALVANGTQPPFVDDTASSVPYGTQGLRYVLTTTSSSTTSTSIVTTN